MFPWRGGTGEAGRGVSSVHGWPEGWRAAALPGGLWAAPQGTGASSTWWQQHLVAAAACPAGLWGLTPALTARRLLWGCPSLPCVPALAHARPLPRATARRSSHGGEAFPSWHHDFSCFLQALIFSCYLSFYKPMSMRTCSSEDGAGPSNVC